VVNCGIDVIDFPLCDLGIFIAVRTNLNWLVRCVAHQLITLTLLFSGLSGVTCEYGAVDWAHALSALVDLLGVGAGAAAAAILLHHTISVGWCQRRRSWCRQTSQRTERFGSVPDVAQILAKNVLGIALAVCSRSLFVFVFGCI